MPVQSVSHRQCQFSVASHSTAPSLDAVASGRAVLRRGMTGESVRTLQALLNRNGAGLSVDGDFGPKTEAAVRNYQAHHGLSVDGVVGPKTMGKLRGAAPSPGPAPVDNAPPGSQRRVTGYRNGQPFNLTVAPVENGKYMATNAAAYKHMDAAASRDGVNLSLVSGFRTMDQQRSLYAAYQNGTGNLAARPGYSNHQGGIAADIDTHGAGRNSAAYRWLRDHGAQYGFRNTVPSEPWHWEFRG